MYILYMQEEEMGEGVSDVDTPVTVAPPTSKPPEIFFSPTSVVFPAYSPGGQACVARPKSAPSGSSSDGTGTRKWYRNGTGMEWVLGSGLGRVEWVLWNGILGSGVEWNIWNRLLGVE